MKNKVCGHLCITSVARLFLKDTSSSELSFPFNILGVVCAFSMPMWVLFMNPVSSFYKFAG